MSLAGFEISTTRNEVQI